MKKQLLTLALTALTFSSFAKIRIADNNGNNPQNYTSLQKAIDDSDVGDTVYVKASATNTDYGNINIGEKITLIGEGYNPKFPNQSSTIYLATFTSDNASGTKIVGLKLGFIQFSNVMTLSNLDISRCHISGVQFVNTNSDVISIYNSKFTNNVINGYLDYGFMTNCELRNNYIKSLLRINSFNNTQIVGGGILIANNIIENVDDVRFAVFQNNYIELLKISQNTPNVGSITFQNNIVQSVENTDLDNPYTLNASNTIAALADEILVYNTQLNLSINWHLTPTAKGINGGTDGTDVGLYGGVYPWPDNEFNSPLVQLPPMDKITDIYFDSKVPAKGTLNVNIKAKSTK